MKNHPYSMSEEYGSPSRRQISFNRGRNDAEIYQTPEGRWLISTPGGPSWYDTPEEAAQAKVNNWFNF
jgi:hypothetical protein